MVVSLLPLLVSVWLSPVPEAKFSHSGHICDHPQDTRLCLGTFPRPCARAVHSYHDWKSQFSGDSKLDSNRH